MTKFFLKAAAGCVALATIAGTAQAADMYRKAPPATQVAAPVSVYNWTGFYAGAHLGGEWLSNKVDTAVGSGRLSPGTVYGGLQAGYNFQTGPWVLGVEGDVGYGRAAKTGPIGFTAARVEKDWSGTVRARAGYAFDRFMVYGTGGLAVASFKTQDTVSSKTSTRAGWTLGAGAEYAVTQNISVKGEYLYADYGKVNNAASSHSLTDHVARVGVNYKF